jgi:hypothetical protein
MAQRRTAWNVTFVLVLDAVIIGSQYTFGDEPASGIKESAVAAGAKRKSSPDGAKTIETLASRNHAPVIRGGDQYEIPLFARDYNWADQDRVVAATRELVDHAERRWPEIVAHLDDTRYCITYDFDTPACAMPKNLSVGDVCKWIISDYLSQPYVWHIPQGGEPAYLGFSIPDVARHGNAALKVWCETRSRKRLYELQIEVCEWAAHEAAKRDGPLSELSDERRRAVVAGIKGQIAELCESKRAIKSERFTGRGTEGAGLYSRERVERTNKAGAAKGEGVF